MKTLIKMLLVAAVFCCSNTNVSAQTAEEEAPQHYHVMDYMKVTPGMDADYRKVEKVWKKIHEANIKSGKYISWELTSVLSPMGESAEYDYVTRTTFLGETQLANQMQEFSMPSNLKALLSPEEMKWFEKTGKVRSFVKSETWASVSYVDDENNSDTDSKIHVFNYFNFPEGGSRSDHIKVENEIWKPIHEHRIKNDKLEAWVLARKVFPFGSEMEYHDATVDVYKDMEQYLNSKINVKLVNQVHPGKDANKLFDQTNAACDLIKGEVRMVIDKVVKEEAVAVKD